MNDRMPRMSTDTSQPIPLKRLFTRYVQVTAVYLLVMVLLWMLGLETIYGHPTPFYALFSPVFDTPAVPLVVLGLAALGYALSRRLVLRHDTPATRTVMAVAAVLAGLYLAALLRDTHTFETGFAAALGRHLALTGWHLPALLCGSGGLLLTYLYLRRAPLDPPWSPAPGEERRFLVAVFLFLVLFSASVAMVRDGFTGISQAYARESYEYIGDIGKTASIRSLFTRYTEIHSYLSMHAKVHPPGPIALLWVLSWLVGRSPLALSIATILCGALAVFPLYAWAKQLFGAAVARHALLLYAVVPSIVLFTATSADILFTPFTLATLWLFDRALQRNSARDAVLAGGLYAVLSLLKFSLLALGAYFAFTGLWRLFARPGHQLAALRVVAKTAALMMAAFLLFHGLVYLWSGFDIFETFRLAKQQFDLDQHHLDQITPRLAAWTYRFWNPMTWFFFAGIPVSVLFLRRLWRPAPEHRGRFLVFLLTLFALNLLYLARGEGERSALYLFPFLVLPAAHLLNACCRQEQSWRPLLATLAFMIFQCWAIESYFYTYW